MLKEMTVSGPRIGRQDTDEEWVMFAGGELEGRRPGARCSACRQRLAAEMRRGRGEEQSPQPGGQPVCFMCYRAELDRVRALRTAGRLFTGSEGRFQYQLPLEPVNRARLTRLRRDRLAARAESSVGRGRFVVRRRQAQIDARHALLGITAGLRERMASRLEASRALEASIHAAELQLPESWLPFVGSR